MSRESGLAGLSPLPASLRSLLESFDRWQGESAVWLICESDGEWIALYPDNANGNEWCEGERHTLETADEPPLAVVLRAGVAKPGQGDFLAGALTLALSHEREARSAARELTDRYEEINLLYFISEVLGSMLSVPDAATRILSEVTDVLGARRASLWVYRREDGSLHLAASVGEGGLRGPIPADDEESATAWVFRERQPLNLERGSVLSAVPRLEPRPHGREAFLSVPINYTPPDDEARTVGVITLVGRRSNVRFSAGDERLLAAIASQVGAALETQRLVQESLRQERLVRELELAHDLQLKLLPDTSTFEAPPDVVARCAPADSVGGDFYQIFRLPGDRLGIMIGDVSSHGFSAAMIMALTMSAVGIYAPESGSPGEVLKRVYRALADELESTEMSLSLFYCVLDAGAGSLVFANAGHPHAFRITAEGVAERLGATGPPLGFVSNEVFEDRSTSWTPASDLLLLFTDGLSDALAQPNADRTGETRLVEAVVERRNQPLHDILAHLFSETENARPGTPADDRTLLLLRG